MQSINRQNKLDVLLKQSKKLFHTADLELLWDIHNKNTLYSTINRYLKNGYLIQIHRGFYSATELKSIDALELGSSAIHSYCYLSTESVLSQSGIIFQHLETRTFCSNKSKKIRINDRTYLVRQLKDKFLYNSVGIINKESHKEATPERAVADMLYFNPKYYLDARNIVDWKKVKNIQKEIGYI